jgi:formate hydrogenlyase transcriptional activator
MTLEAYQRDYIVKVLERTGWRIRGKNGAAEILGLKPTTLYSRMEKLGIKKPDSV